MPATFNVSLIFLLFALSSNACAAFDDVSRLRLSRMYSEALDLSEKQFEELRSLEKSTMKKRTKIIRRHATSAKRSELNKIKRANRDHEFELLYQDYKRSVKKILTTKQKKRLEQLLEWREVRDGQFRWFRSKKLREMLEITSAQQSAQEKIIKEADADYQKRVNKELDDIREEIFKVLTPSQKKQLEKLRFDRKSFR